VTRPLRRPGARNPLKEARHPGGSVNALSEPSAPPGPPPRRAGGPGVSNVRPPRPRDRISARRGRARAPSPTAPEEAVSDGTHGRGRRTPYGVAHGSETPVPLPKGADGTVPGVREGGHGEVACGVTHPRSVPTRTKAVQHPASLPTPPQGAPPACPAGPALPPGKGGNAAGRDGRGGRPGGSRRREGGEASIPRGGRGRACWGIRPRAVRCKGRPWVQRSTPPPSPPCLDQGDAAPRDCPGPRDGGGGRRRGRRGRKKSPESVPGGGLKAAMGRPAPLPARSPGTGKGSGGGRGRGVRQRAHPSGTLAGEVRGASRCRGRLGGVTREGGFVRS